MPAITASAIWCLQGFGVDVVDRTPVAGARLSVPDRKYELNYLVSFRKLKKKLDLMISPLRMDCRVANT